ncbi:MAG: sulfur oxidation c-type cytochrome SoxA [Rhodobacterales bacterium]|nr:sulfur oxidation c-type cytochrome SoxA [Rhodobacterales bacterium]
MKRTLMGVAAAGLMAFGLSATAAEMKAIDKASTTSAVRSGFSYAISETREMQTDDIQNPSFLWVDIGEEQWGTVDGEAGKSCESCHGNAADTMANVGSTYPVWDPATKKPMNVELRINKCRAENMKAKPWKYESDELLGMTAYIKSVGRGKPIHVSLKDGDMEAWSKKGEQFYYQRRGLLDLSCAHCHEQNPGNLIRAETLSQGQTNGFPTYRLKWQKLGSLHRRFRGCNNNIRAEPYAYGSDEYLALETYLAQRGANLPVEGPSVRK